MITRNVLRNVVYLGVGMFLSAPLFPGRVGAQTAAPAAPQASEGRSGVRDMYQQTVNELNLSDDQKGKVNDIFTDAKAKREAIFKDTTLSQDQKKEKMKGLHEETRTKVNEVLTPEQRTELKGKMEAVKAKAPAAQ
jgi:Spy/CpxP family protein refolding chaperone